MLALSRRCKLLGLSLSQCCAGNGVLRLTGRFALADVSTIQPDVRYLPRSKSALSRWLDLALGFPNVDSGVQASALNLR
jgi:hypothetical protein